MYRTVLSLQPRGLETKCLVEDETYKLYSQQSALYLVAQSLSPDRNLQKLQPSQSPATVSQECSLMSSLDAHRLLTPARVEHSHWSRSVEILCSDWWNYAGAKVYAITTHLKASA